MLFKPSKIVVDHVGTMYIQDAGNPNGLVQLTSDGEFLGYFGANYTTPDMAYIIKFMFSTKEQKKKGVSCMAESYCLKSCTDCTREGCSGCKTGGFAGQCEIARGCKEKNHESCDSCTRSLYCPTRTGRDQRPEKIFAMERRIIRN